MREDLTRREKQILKFFSFSNPEIANRLFISISTVKRHVHNILKKLKEPTKIRAVIKAVKEKVITIEELITK